MVSDVSRRRKMLLDVMKRDVRRSLGAIAIALDNPDSETSHYAASVVMDALSEFRGNVQNMHVRFKQDPEDFELGSLLLEYINEVLNQNILTGDEKRSYTYLEDEIGDLLYPLLSAAGRGAAVSEADGGSGGCGRLPYRREMVPQSVKAPGLSAGHLYRVY